MKRKKPKSKRFNPKAKSMKRANMKITKKQLLSATGGGGGVDTVGSNTVLGRSPC